MPLSSEFCTEFHYDSSKPPVATPYALIFYIACAGTVCASHEEAHLNPFSILEYAEEASAPLVILAQRRSCVPRYFEEIARGERPCAVPLYIVIFGGVAASAAPVHMVSRLLVREDFSEDTASRYSLIRSFLCCFRAHLLASTLASYPKHALDLAADYSPGLAVSVLAQGMCKQLLLKRAIYHALVPRLARTVFSTLGMSRSLNELVALTPKPCMPFSFVSKRSMACGSEGLLASAVSGESVASAHAVSGESVVSAPAASAESVASAPAMPDASAELGVPVAPAVPAELAVPAASASLAASGMDLPLQPMVVLAVFGYSLVIKSLSRRLLGSGLCASLCLKPLVWWASPLLLSYVYLGMVYGNLWYRSGHMLAAPAASSDLKPRC